MEKKDMETTVNFNQPCFDCGSLSRVYTLKLVPTNRPDLPRFPKFIPQVKESCKNCRRYIRFTLQTPELIYKFNSILPGVEVNEDV